MRLRPAEIAEKYKKEIKSNKALGMSMMPEGLLSGLSDAEVRDLIGYLMAPAQVKAE